MTCEVKSYGQPALLRMPWFIYAGDDEVLQLTLKAGGEPLDVTDLELTSAWKAHIDDTETEPIEVQVTDAVNGKIQLVLSHQQTALSGKIHSGVWDLQAITQSGFVRTLVRGTTSWSKDVTP